MAIQTLWAGPWMKSYRVYSFESATGLFWINVTMLIAFLSWGYIFLKFQAQ